MDLAAHPDQGRGTHAQPPGPRDRASSSSSCATARLTPEPSLRTPAGLAGVLSVVDPLDKTFARAESPAISLITLCLDGHAASRTAERQAAAH